MSHGSSQVIRLIVCSCPRFLIFCSISLIDSHQRSLAQTTFFEAFHDNFIATEELFFKLFHSLYLVSNMTFPVKIAGNAISMGSYIAEMVLKSLFLSLASLSFERQLTDYLPICSTLSQVISFQCSSNPNLTLQMAPHCLLLLVLHQALLHSSATQARNHNLQIFNLVFLSSLLLLLNCFLRGEHNRHQYL